MQEGGLSGSSVGISVLGGAGVRGAGDSEGPEGPTCQEPERGGTEQEGGRGKGGTELPDEGPYCVIGDVPP